MVHMPVSNFTLSKYHPDPNQLLSCLMLIAFSFPRYLVSMTNLSFLKIATNTTDTEISEKFIDFIS